MEPECLIATVIYLDRFQKNTGCRVTIKNYQILVFTSMLIASKTWDDSSCTTLSFCMS